MHEPLFAACRRGAAAVLSLTRGTLDAAVARRGKDAPLAYPDTAYELPVAFGLTDLRVTTLADAGKVLDLAETLVRDGATAENALDAGAATLLAADVLGALSHENGNPYPPPAVGFVPDS
ncbi:MAG: CO dehydrogenase/CO-methylating acetyl-CoA synthase complex subunit beta, partial [Actinomycetota bacterium]